MTALWSKGKKNLTESKNSHTNTDKTNPWLFVRFGILRAVVDDGVYFNTPY